jgi:uncharacterized membrane protein
MTAIAATRPEGWDFPLLLHLLGAMLLVGTLVLAASALVLAWRDGSAALVGLGYRVLLIGALPASGLVPPTAAVGQPAQASSADPAAGRPPTSSCQRR